MGKAEAWIGKNGDAKSGSSLPPMNGNPKSTSDNTIIAPKAKKEKQLLGPLKESERNHTQTAQLSGTELANVGKGRSVSHRRQKASIGEGLH